MPWVQRNEAAEVIGRFANLQPGYAEEWLDDDHPDLAWVSLPVQAENERLWRDGVIADIRWLRERHRDEQDLQQEPTLTADQFGELLAYLQQRVTGRNRRTSLIASSVRSPRPGSPTKPNNAPH